MKCTLVAAPPSIQHAALHAPILEKAETGTGMLMITEALAIALTVSQASFLASALLVPCSIFLSGSTLLLISRAVAMTMGTPYYAFAMLVTLLPFASRKDILISLSIGVIALLVAPAAAMLVEVCAVAVTTNAPHEERNHHHHLIVAAALGLCAATDHVLQILLFSSYCVVGATKLYMRFVIKNM